MLRRAFAPLKSNVGEVDNSNIFIGATLGWNFILEFSHEFVNHLYRQLVVF
jgi:hypothetical protein